MCSVGNRNGGMAKVVLGSCPLSVFFIIFWLFFFRLEPREYTCSFCRRSAKSACSLVQHVQLVQGVQIFWEQAAVLAPPATMSAGGGTKRRCLTSSSSGTKSTISEAAGVLYLQRRLELLGCTQPAPCAGRRPPLPWPGPPLQLLRNPFYPYTLKVWIYCTFFC